MANLPFQNSLTFLIEQLRKLIDVSNIFRHYFILTTVWIYLDWSWFEHMVFVSLVESSEMGAHLRRDVPCWRGGSVRRGPTRVTMQILAVRTSNIVSMGHLTSTVFPRHRCINHSILPRRHLIIRLRVKQRIIYIVFISEINRRHAIKKRRAEREAEGNQLRRRPRQRTNAGPQLQCDPHEGKAAAKSLIRFAAATSGGHVEQRDVAQEFIQRDPQCYSVRGLRGALPPSGHPLVAISIAIGPGQTYI